MMPVSRKKTVVIAALLIFLSISSAKMHGQSIKDPHRPACADSQCRAIRAFVKGRYCGESPYGNGPDNGCDIRLPKHRLPGTSVTASFDCDWSDSAGKTICQQTGNLSPETRTALIKEMRQAGLPERSDKEVFFNILDSKSTGWSLMEAYYGHVEGDNLTTCQVIVARKQGGPVHLLRKVPFQKSDSDGKTITTWSALEIANVNGQSEFILEGDAYENHWLEVVGMKDGVFKTTFSGLGYYL
jgi:hypothetical protein